MLRCALCGNECSHPSFFTNAMELSSGIVLLSCMIMNKAVDESIARKLYNDLKSAPQRICKNHYIQAVKFLRKEIERLWNNFPLTNLQDVPCHVIENVIKNLRPYSTKLDDKACMERGEVVAFYYDCMVNYDNEVLNNLLSQDGSEDVPNLMHVCPKDYAHEQKVSSESSPCKSADTASHEPILFNLTEEKPLQSKEISATDLLTHHVPCENSSIEVDRYEEQPTAKKKEQCVLCGKLSPDVEIMQTLEIREHYVILLSCLVMGNVIPLHGAPRVYQEILCTRKPLCKQHYTQAIQFLSDEVRILSCNLQSERRLEQLPYNVLTGLLKRIQSYGTALDKDAPLRVDHLVQFYTDYVGMCKAEVKSPQVALEPNDCKPTIQPSCSAGINTIVSIGDRYERREHIDSALTSKRHRKNITELRQHTCAVCGRRRPETELCVTSFSHDQNIVMLSCLVMGRSIEMAMAKKIYDSIKYKSKCMCIRHYIDAARFICSEVQRASGSFPKNGFRHVPGDIRFSFLWRIQQCGDLIDGTIELKDESLLRFYNKCDVRYHITRTWRDQEFPHHRRPQRLIDERSDENGYETAGTPPCIPERSYKRQANSSRLENSEQKRLKGMSVAQYDDSNDISDQEMSRFSTPLGSSGSIYEFDMCPNGSRDDFARESRCEEEPSRMSSSGCSNDGNFDRSPSFERFRQQERESSSSTDAVDFSSFPLHFLGFKEKTDRLLQSNNISLASLGQAIAQHECGADYQEFVTTRLRDARVSINAAKALQIAATQVPSPSDSVVRALFDLVAQQSDVIVGLTSVVDSVMLNVKELRGELARSNGLKLMERKLPEETHLHYKNLTRQWNIPEMAPFRATNLNKLMDGWRRSNRARDDDHVSHCVDFYRLYLVNACEPIQVIQNYACRQSGRCAKSEHLQDLPEPIARVLVECCVDGLRLGASELLMTLDEIRMKPTKYWRDLGPTDTVRAKVLSDRKKARAEWGALCRTALGRALADVRQYVFKNAKLVPRPKRRTIDSIPS